MSDFFNPKNKLAEQYNSLGPGSIHEVPYGVAPATDVPKETTLLDRIKYLEARVQQLEQQHEVFTNATNTSFEKMGEYIQSLARFVGR